MTASEKLKALADDPYAERWRVVRAEDGENSITQDRVYAALPQIVAVVETLEKLREWDVLNLPPGSGDDGPYWRDKIDTCLAALNKKLEDGKS